MGASLMRSFPNTLTRRSALDVIDEVRDAAAMTADMHNSIAARACLGRIRMMNHFRL